MHTIAIGSRGPHAPHRSVLQAAFAFVLVAAIAGCQKRPTFELAEVMGRVTIDGQPVKGLMLHFEPSPQDAAGKVLLPPAYGFTAADGRYSLTCTGGKKGAVVGRNHVRITAAEGNGPRAQVSARYARDDSLWYDVKPGVNKFNIALHSDPPEPEPSPEPDPNPEPDPAGEPQSTPAAAPGAEPDASAPK